MMQNVTMAAVVGNIQKVEKGVQKFKGVQNNFLESDFKSQLKIATNTTLQKSSIPSETHFALVIFRVFTNPSR